MSFHARENAIRQLANVLHQQQVGCNYRPRGSGSHVEGEYDTPDRIHGGEHEDVAQAIANVARALVAEGR
jgi:hypothetical protein